MAARITQQLEALSLKQGAPDDDDRPAAALPTMDLSSAAPFETVGADYIVDIWKSVVFDGHGGKTDTFPIGYIKTGNILPKYQCKIQNLTIYFSDKFLWNGSQMIFAIVVEDEKTPVARLFYLSTSQCFWRSFAGIYAFNKRIYKGDHESSIQLPIILHLTLINATKEQFEIKEFYKNAFLIDAVVPSVKFDCDSSIHHTFPKDTQPFAFMHPVDDQPTQVGKKGSTFMKWTKPELLDFESPSNAPDYENAQIFEYPNSTYGPVFCYLIDSVNKEFTFLFYSICIPELFIDEPKKTTPLVFLAHVERKASKVNRFCVFDTFPQVYDLTNPLYDYLLQIPKKFQMSLFSSERTEKKSAVYKPPYYCAWNYVRELRVIQAFYERVLKCPMPDRV